MQKIVYFRVYSLGVNTTYKGQYCLLSAAHVLTRFNRANLGKEINAQSDSSEDYQPMGTTVEDQVDVVLYGSPQDQALSMLSRT